MPLVNTLVIFYIRPSEPHLTLEYQYVSIAHLVDVFQGLKLKDFRVKRTRIHLCSKINRNALLKFTLQRVTNLQ